MAAVPPRDEAGAPSGVNRPDTSVSISPVLALSSGEGDRHLLPASAMAPGARAFGSSASSTHNKIYNGTVRQLGQSADGSTLLLPDAYSAAGGLTSEGSSAGSMRPTLGNDASQSFSSCVHHYDFE